MEDPKTNAEQQQPAGETAPEADKGKKPARRLPIEKLDMRRLMQLDACTRCGECLNWCPVHDQDAREELIPRTKILNFLKIVKNQHSFVKKMLDRKKGGEALKGIIRKMLGIEEITEEMVQDFALSLYECSTCGQCAVVCPAGIDTVELWEDIRQLIVEAGYGPLEPQKVLVKSVKAYDNPWQQPRQGRAKWARRAQKDGQIKAPPPDIKKNPAKVLLFFGCTAVFDVNVRQIAINTVNIFDTLGIDYGCLGGEEKCCGSVLLRMGDAEFERIATDNIDMFNDLDIDTLVTSCSGCFKTIRDDYPKVKPLNFKVLHVVEYLKRLMEDGCLSFKNPLNKKVTYHDPCHLGRVAGVFDAPREIMAAIPGLELVEMERIMEYSRCCGAGGGVKAGFPDIQTRMSQRRIQEAEATGASELISGCPFCFAGLQVGIKATDSPLVMKDVTSLVAESLLGEAAFAASTGAQAVASPKAAKEEVSAKAASGGKPSSEDRKKAREAKRAAKGGAKIEAPAVAQAAEADEKPSAEDRKKAREAKRAAKAAGVAPAPAAPASPAPAAAAPAPAPEPAAKKGELSAEERKAAREAKRAAKAAKKPDEAPAPAAPEPPSAAAEPAPAAVPEPEPAPKSEAETEPLSAEDRKKAREAKRAAKAAARKG